MNQDENNELPVIPHDLDGTFVAQRIEDGFVNATAMCKASSKLFADYRRAVSTEEFLQELSSDMGIPISGLIVSLKGGVSHAQGTWIHPDVAIHLAQWCSPRFAVAVSRWVREWMTGKYRITDKLQAHDKWLDEAWKTTTSGLAHREILRQKAVILGLMDLPSWPQMKHAEAPTDLTLTLETFWDAALIGIRKAFDGTTPPWLKLETTSSDSDKHSFFGKLLIARDSLINAVINVHPAWSFYSENDYETILRREQSWIKPGSMTCQSPGEPPNRRIYWGFCVNAVSRPDAMVEIARLVGGL